MKVFKASWKYSCTPMFRRSFQLLRCFSKYSTCKAPKTIKGPKKTTSNDQNMNVLTSLYQFIREMGVCIPLRKNVQLRGNSLCILFISLYVLVIDFVNLVA